MLKQVIPDPGFEKEMFSLNSAFPFYMKYGIYIVHFS